MRAVASRVAWARVVADGEVTGEIGPGLLVLVGVAHGDSEDDAAWLAAKVAALRVFDDDQGKMNRSLVDVGGGALVVSQFTLAADLRGNRPGFSTAAPPAEGERLYELFAEEVARLGIPTQRGRFGADMKVSLVNDGPVTILLETPPKTPLAASR